MRKSTALSPTEEERVFGQIPHPSLTDRNAFNLVKELGKEPAGGVRLSAETCTLPHPKLQGKTSRLHCPGGLDFAIRHEKTKGVETGQKVTIP